jgi:hypothetical protein
MATKSTVKPAGDGTNPEYLSREAPNPTIEITDSTTLLQWLETCNPPLDKKIIDITCHSQDVPSNLHEEVAQEVRLLWSRQHPNPAYNPRQIASYAHKIAGKQALRVKRDLGSAARLPGSAFRIRKDGTSYVTAGILAQPLDWNALEVWMDLDDSTGGEVNSAMSGGADMSYRPIDADYVSDSHLEEETRRDRIDSLTRVKHMLTARQFAIVQSMIEGANMTDIMAEFGIKKGVLIREVNIAATFIGPELLS